MVSILEIIPHCFLQITVSVKSLNHLHLSSFYVRSTGFSVVWRGVPEDLSAVYPKGKEQTWWAFSSCTSSVSVLESPQYLGTSGTRTMFSIETKNGKCIRPHSYFQHEDEILLPPATYLKVIDRMSPGNGLHIIHLQEMTPPFPLLAEPFDLNKMKQALPQSKSSSSQKGKCTDLFLFAQVFVRNI
jgi:hypothetical protein